MDSERITARARLMPKTERKTQEQAMNTVIRPGFCRIMALALGLVPAASGLWRADASDGKGTALLPQVQTINKEIAAGWKRDPGDRSKDLTPSRQASDYEFIRRATLDVIG